MAKKKQSKQRTDFRKKYQGRVRRGDLTRDFQSGDDDRLADVEQGERVSGKGDLTRKRTVAGIDDQAPQSFDRERLAMSFVPSTRVLSTGAAG